MSHRSNNANKHFFGEALIFFEQIFLEIEKFLRSFDEIEITPPLTGKTKKPIKSFSSSEYISALTFELNTPN